MDLDPQLKERLSALVASDDVVLFMKGVRSMPQCGFSAAVVGVLDQYLPEYTTVNVLAEPSVREGVKLFSDWPTIPQLYVRGEFLGGCDIVREMDHSGELKQVLGDLVRAPAPPSVTLTDAAKQMVEAALADAGDDDFLRLSIDAGFNNDLFVGSREPSDVEAESNGMKILFDAGSARRAEGLTIDFVDIGTGQGFKITNPNAPEGHGEPEPQQPSAQVKDMSVQELKAKLDAGDEFVLIDVRTPGEREIVCIDGSRPFDAKAMAELQGLPRDRPLIFHCKSGGRSSQAAEHFLRLGFSNVYNVVGGIDAWANEIDPSLPRY
jgi:monothiol glutaredoxin